MIELPTASGIAAMLMGTTLIFLTETAKESRRGLADAMVEEVADDLQQKITGILRVESASQSTDWLGAVSSSSGITGFTQIVMAQGPSSQGYPREQLSFDPASGACSTTPIVRIRIP